MQKWQYKVFASHLDPAELVLVLDEAGQEGWELVALAGVVEYQPPEVLELTGYEDASSTEEAGELVPVEAFRYVFKRQLV